LSIKFAARVIACLALASLFSSLSAQQTTPPATTDSAGQTQTQTPPQTSGQNQGTSPAQTPPGKDADKDKNQTKTNGQGTSNVNASGTSNDRLFYTLPNFLSVENAGQLAPLSAKEKFWVVTRGSFDYILIPWYGFLSGIAQAQDSEPGLGQGAAGYGKRFATSFADGTIENYMTGAVLPSLLHEDPRFYELGHGSFLHRTWYAASRNIITRRDSGQEDFNYSEVVGGMFSAAFSTYTYHPKSHVFPTTTPGVYRFVPSDRTLTNTAKVWGTQFGYDAMTLVVKEFWPDIHRKVSRKYREESMRPSPSSTPNQ
jgi:hypothetical protein